MSTSARFQRARRPAPAGGASSRLAPALALTGNMPGFKWNDATKFKSMAQCINDQMSRDRGGPGWGNIVADEKGFVDWQMCEKYEHFMSDVLNAFPHGPPCIGSLKIAVRFYVELERLPAAPDCWIEHEANKIHVLWRFVWMCFQRTPRSRYHALDRLKAILTLQRSGRERLDPAAEDADAEDSHDSDWPDDDDAKLATPARPAPRQLVAVVSVASSDDENARVAGARVAGASAAGASVAGASVTLESNGRSQSYIAADDLLPGLTFQEDCLRDDVIESPGAQLQETPPSRKKKKKQRLVTMGITPTSVAPPTHMDLTPLDDEKKEEDEKKEDEKEEDEKKEEEGQEGDLADEKKEDDPFAPDQENDDPARFDDAWERMDDPLPLKKKRRKKTPTKKKKEATAAEPEDPAEQHFQEDQHGKDEKKEEDNAKEAQPVNSRKKKKAKGEGPQQPKTNKKKKAKGEGQPKTNKKKKAKGEGQQKKRRVIKKAKGEGQPQKQKVIKEANGQATDDKKKDESKPKRTPKAEKRKPPEAAGASGQLAPAAAGAGAGKKAKISKEELNAVLNPISEKELKELLAVVKPKIKAWKALTACPGEIRTVRKIEGGSAFTQICKGSRILGQVTDKMFGPTARSAVNILTAAAEAGYDKDDFVKIKHHLLDLHRLKAD